MEHNIKNLKKAEKLTSQARRLVAQLSVSSYHNRTERLNKIVERARQRVERRSVTLNEMYAAQRAKLYA